MGRVSLLLRAASALTVLVALAACTAGGQFDPTEMVSADIFNTKKKIAGDREPLFPEGVPGAETGVPPDLVKGYQPPAEPQPAAETPDAAKQTAAQEKPKPKPKPKPKVAHAPAAPAHDPAFDQKPASMGQPAQAPWPAAPQPQSSQTNWPAPAQAAPSAQTNWPNPPSSAH